jgi:hypothetical protein
MEFGRVREGKGTTTARTFPSPLLQSEIHNPLPFSRESQSAARVPASELVGEECSIQTRGTTCFGISHASLQRAHAAQCIQATWMTGSVRSGSKQMDFIAGSTASPSPMYPHLVNRGVACRRRRHHLHRGIKAGGGEWCEQW